jgi:hypothetical protein
MERRKSRPQKSVAMQKPIFVFFHPATLFLLDVSHVVI